MIYALVLLVVSCLAQSPAYADDRLVQLVKFHDYDTGSIDDWLIGKGFSFERDARRRDRLGFDIGEEVLVLAAHRRALGLMPNESINVPEFDFVEIDWGVHKHPAGASYEQGVRNEAIMAIIFLGDERQPSGSIFIPDSPHFVGLFLCSGDDKINHPYRGSYFTKTGRYVCLDRPAPGELVTSRFNLRQAYRQYFDKENDDDPGVSGIALALDTKKARDGQASAFIREIRFYKD
ncbi:MAG: hypothetical protein AAF993_19115 [Pseudomonadota bacterium]